MNLLVLSQHIGRTASGIVFENILNSLSKNHNLTISTLNNDLAKDSPLLNRVEIIIHPYSTIINQRVNYHIDKLSTYFSPITLSDFRASKRLKRFPLGNFDAIIALCARPYLGAMLAGIEIKNKIKKPLIVYCVDPVPTPDWWTSSLGNKKAGAFIYDVTKSVDCFLTANPIMLEFQKKYISEKCPIVDYIYTPGAEFDNKKMLKKESSYTFLYTGSIYGKRTPIYIFKAFDIFCKSHPEARLKFIATNESIINEAPDSIIDNIEFLPFTTDLTPHYSDSLALIDIDAAVDFEIFQSSKLANYLMIDKPIICETGSKSPARHILNDLKSAFVCGHNADEILEAMERVASSRFDYSDRDNIRKMLTADQCAKKLESFILKTTNQISLSQIQ